MFVLETHIFLLLCVFLFELIDILRGALLPYWTGIQTSASRHSSTILLCSHTQEGLKQQMLCAPRVCQTMSGSSSDHQQQEGDGGYQMSLESPFVNTRQRNRTFSPPVCTEGCFLFFCRVCRRWWRWWGVMIYTGSQNGHMMSTREVWEGSSCRVRLNIQLKMCLWINLQETTTKFAILMLICFIMRWLLRRRPTLTV